MWRYLRQLSLLRACGRRGGCRARLETWRIGMRRQPRPVPAILIHCNLLPFPAIDQLEPVPDSSYIENIMMKKTSNKMDTEAALEDKLVLVRHAVMKFSQFSCTSYPQDYNRCGYKALGLYLEWTACSQVEDKVSGRCVRNKEWNRARK